MVDQSLLSQAVIRGDCDEVTRLTVVAVNLGMEPQDIVTHTLQPAMSVVGEKYSTGEFFLPEMLLAARAMGTAFKVLEPLLSGVGVPSIGKIVIGTVKGDIHDIGKNIVAMFLKSVGFQIFDLGVDVPEEKFVEAVRRIKPDILGLSALITTTMMSMDSVIKALDTVGVRSNVRVIIGGAPVTQDYANLIGADAYASDVAEAARICKELIGDKVA